MVRCSRIRNRLGLENTGQTIESALRYRDKLVMKRVLKDAGIRVPDFASVECPQDIFQFYEKFGPKIGKSIFTTHGLTSSNQTKVWLWFCQYNRNSKR